MLPVHVKIWQKCSLLSQGTGRRSRQHSETWRRILEGRWRIERLPCVEDFLPRFKEGDSGLMEKRKNDLKSTGCSSLTMDADGEIVSDTTEYPEDFSFGTKKDEKLCFINHPCRGAFRPYLLVACRLQVSRISKMQ
jgi:hypothetical protein